MGWMVIDAQKYFLIEFHLACGPFVCVVWFELKIVLQYYSVQLFIYVCVALVRLYIILNKVF